MLLSSYDSRHMIIFNDTATTESFTLSLHDALPIYSSDPALSRDGRFVAFTSDSDELVRDDDNARPDVFRLDRKTDRSEEHTSELQSRQYLVCRLLLEKEKRSIEVIPHGRTKASGNS